MVKRYTVPFVQFKLYLCVKFNAQAPFAVNSAEGKINKGY